ncbi:hypothetical protein AB0D67_07700 [Streptosporangium sp. NPDC048047]|uniref:hypothetical protein n=1 Tax=Streptosporangium sp. NPDC048047 TaxID=3155748 RepID=UPI003442A1AC
MTSPWTEYRASRAGDAQARLRYLDRTVRLLFPDAGEARPHSLLPHPVLPRRLVPRRWWHPGRRIMVPSGEDTIETYLGEALSAPVRVVLHVRPARRANRKPILEAHTPDGLAAFVKIGDTGRTRALVTNEARALGLLADVPLKTVVPPVVLHHGTWRGLSVLALSPLPVRRGPVAADLVAEAVGEIGRLGRTHRDGPPGGLAGSGGRGPTGEGDPVGGNGPVGGGGPAFPNGPADGPDGFAWHGDFSPWNIARGPDRRLLVWDWERFATGVPLGFDAVHHFFQRALRRTDPATAARACVTRALRVLAPFGLTAAEARLTAARYLIALADRHAADGHSPLGPPARWLGPAVDFEEALI